MSLFRRIRRLKSIDYSNIRNLVELCNNVVCRKKHICVQLNSGIIIYIPSIRYLLLIDEILFKHVYNPPGFEIHEGDVIIDVGANIGIFSIYASAIPNTQVHSFEPFRENVELLMCNIKINNLNNCFVNPLACSNINGPGKLFLTDLSTRISLINRDVISEKELDRYIIVKNITLEKYIEQHNIEKIDFLKLDCEGSEGLIFKDISSQTLEKISKIAMEFHDNVSPLNHKEINKLLIKAGFSTEVLWDGKDKLGFIYAMKK